MFSSITSNFISCCASLRSVVLWMSRWGVVNFFFHVICDTPFLLWDLSSLFMPSLFLRLFSFFGCLHFWNYLHFWGRLHIWYGLKFFRLSSYLLSSSFLGWSSLLRSSSFLRPSLKSSISNMKYDFFYLLNFKEWSIVTQG